MKKIILSLLLLCSLNIVSAQRITNEWSNRARYAKKNAELTVRPDAIFMGNSITQAWALKRPEFFEAHNYVGRGISGQVSAQMLLRFRDDVVENNPKCVVILAGINDIAENQWVTPLGDIMDNIASMAQIARANGIRPILCSVLPANRIMWREGIEPTQQVIDLNVLIKEFAKEQKMTYVDYYSALVDDKFGLSEEYAKDGVHPLPPAYEIMEEMIVKVITKEIKRVK